MQEKWVAAYRMFSSLENDTVVEQIIPEDMGTKRNSFLKLRHQFLKKIHRTWFHQLRKFYSSPPPLYPKMLHIYLFNY